MGKKKKDAPSANEPVLHDEIPHEEKHDQELVDKGPEKVEEPKQEHVVESKEAEKVAEPIHSHAKFAKFKKPSGGEK